MALIETSPDASTQTARLVRDVATGIYNQMRAAYENGANLLWHNPFGLTPQQVCDALGTDAGEMVTKAAALRAFLNAQVGSEVLANSIPAGVTVTVNQDGTVTLS